MSIYAQAVMSTADALTGASADAAYDAAYGTVYKAATQMHNAAQRKVTAEANIAAIKQDNINSATIIGMNQDAAEAQAKVYAAATGTEGGSVNATIYQTEVSSTRAVQQSTKQANQQIENQLSNVYAAQSTLLAVDDPQLQQIDPIMSAVNAVAGNITKEEWGSAMEGAGKIAENFGW
jgi:hypothetical protein